MLSTLLCFMQHAKLKKCPSNVWRRKNLLTTNVTLKGESHRQWTRSKCLVDWHLCGTLQIEKWLFIREVYLCGIPEDQYFWSGTRWYEIIRVNKHNDGKKTDLNIVMWNVNGVHIPLRLQSLIAVLFYLCLIAKWNYKFRNITRIM